MDVWVSATEWRTNVHLTFATTQKWMPRRWIETKRSLLILIPANGKADEGSVLDANATPLWFLCVLQLYNLCLQTVLLNRSPFSMQYIASTDVFLFSTASKSINCSEFPTNIYHVYANYLICHCIVAAATHETVAQQTAQCNLHAHSIKNLILNSIRNWLPASRNRKSSSCPVWQLPQQIWMAYDGLTLMLSSPLSRIPLTEQRRN